MDANKLGPFITARRKELGMTQAELAAKLHLSDKTVSKWERCAGLPDIGNIEPLADALGIGLVELMQAHRSDEEQISKRAVEQMLSETLLLSGRQGRKISRVGVGILAAFAVIAVLLLLLLARSGSIVLFSVGSLILGLAAWAIPVQYLAYRKICQIEGRIISSMGLAMASVMLQMAQIARDAMLGDWAAIGDTAAALTAIVVIFSVVTVCLNGAMYLERTMDTRVK